MDDLERKALAGLSYSLSTGVNYELRVNDPKLKKLWDDAVTVGRIQEKLNQEGKKNNDGRA